MRFTAPTKTFNIAGLLCSNVITVNPELKREFDVAAEEHRRPDRQPFRTRRVPSGI